MLFYSDTEKSRSVCFDWHNCIRSGINHEILLHILFFGLALFVKSLNLTCLFKKISASLILSKFCVITVVLVFIVKSIHVHMYHH